MFVIGAAGMLTATAGMASTIM